MPFLGLITRDGTLLFDGAAQQVGSIPLEADPHLVPAVASVVTRGLAPTIVAPATLACPTASVVTRGIAPTITVPAVGPNGAVTVYFDLESGGKLTYSYKTDVLRMRTGLEYRQALLDYPRRAFEFSLLLDDAQARDLKSRLFTAAALAQPINLAMWNEALTLSADAAGNSVFVASTTLADWAVSGRRCVVAPRDQGVAIDAVVGAVGAGTLSLSVAPGSAGSAGGFVMPTEVVWLEATQSFAYQGPVGFEKWDLKGVAAYMDPLLGALGTGSAAIATFAGLPVWDYGLGADGSVDTSMLFATEDEDDGWLPGRGSVQTFGDVQRTINLRVRNDALRQWVKKFFATMLGQQGVFYLPSWKYDLLPQSQPSTTQIKVYGNGTSGAGDYTRWFQSAAARALMLWMSDGTYQYVTVSAATDNGDGTITLNTSAYSGTIAHLSLLEKVRFATDDLVFEMTASYSDVSLPAITVLQ